MLSEDQRVRFRTLSVGVAVMWVTVGLLSGWPLWVWALLAGLSLLAPSLLTYVMAERILRKGRKQSPANGSVPSRSPSGGGSATAGSVDSRHGVRSVPSSTKSAAHHAVELVRGVPSEPRRNLLANDLAELLDTHDLRSAARDVRREFCEGADDSTDESEVDPRDEAVVVGAWDPANRSFFEELTDARPRIPETALPQNAAAGTDDARTQPRTEDPDDGSD